MNVSRSLFSKSWTPLKTASGPWGVVLVLTLSFGLAGCASDSGASGDDAAETTADASDVALDGDLPEAVELVETAETLDAALDAVDVEAEGETVVPPRPFELPRDDQGEPLSDEEVAAFTTAITGFWKEVEYFRWVRLHSHGMDPSNPDGYPDYALWWQDTQAVKEGDTVAFVHTGGADNLALRTAKVFNNVASGYLAFGGDDMRWLTMQYMKGFMALAKAMEKGEDDPAPYIVARAIFTHNHAYETVGGRKVRVDYDPVKQEESFGWNAASIPMDDNPYYGDIWVRNQRSKDDVPHLYRSVPVLRRLVAEATDEEVQQVAVETLEYFVGFAKDIVDHDYQIRTKFSDGVAVVPTKEDGFVKDLASFTLYDAVDPRSECTAMLSSALIAYGEPLDNECLDGSGGLYEKIATTGHYFNYAIIRYFHAAAIANAIDLGQDEVATALMLGMYERADRMMHDENMPNHDAASWKSDVAAALLAAAAAGLPLTSEEARLIAEQYTASAEHYAAWTYWDPWDASVEDGNFDYKPQRDVAVRPTELAFLIEYCASPYLNANGARLIDCEQVLDPERWGE